jgi:hypothetical protein
MARAISRVGCRIACLRGLSAGVAETEDWAAVGAMRLAFLLDATDASESRLRLTELQAVCALILNCNHLVVSELARAITDPGSIEGALTALTRVPSLQRRRILATFGALQASCAGI